MDELNRNTGLHESVCAGGVGSRSGAPHSAWQDEQARKRAKEDEWHRGKAEEGTASISVAPPLSSETYEPICPTAPPQPAPTAGGDILVVFGSIAWLVWNLTYGLVYAVLLPILLADGLQRRALYRSRDTGAKPSLFLPRSIVVCYFIAILVGIVSLVAVVVTSNQK